jgi:hypothetical protein
MFAQLHQCANLVAAILAPLTSVTELATHQTLSVPFTSNTLTELTNQGAELARKENRSLWKVKHLMTGLVGDYAWAPCGLMLGPNDAGVFASEEVLRQQAQATNGVAGSSPATLNGDARTYAQTEGPNGQPGVADKIQPVEKTGTDSSAGDLEVVERNKAAKADKSEQPPENAAQRDGEAGDDRDPKAAKNDAASGGASSGEAAGEKSLGAGVKDETTGEQSVDMQDAEPTAARTAEPKGKEAQNGAASSAQATPPQDGASSSSDDDGFVHPLFQIPPIARPDKDIGLPDMDADRLRHLLALYIQKQEEICRGARKLHDGLLKADRLRKEVLRWSKAEAHCGPNRDMSDGEDWYDKEEWGLEEDLKKGQDEEEEETGTTTKKTRNRK